MAWQDDLLELLTATDEDPINDILLSRPGQAAIGALTSDPAEFIFKTLDLPASVARGGIGSLVNIGQGEGFAGVGLEPDSASGTSRWRDSAAPTWGHSASSRGRSSLAPTSPSIPSPTPASALSVRGPGSGDGGQPGGPRGTPRPRRPPARHRHRAAGGSDHQRSTGEDRPAAAPGRGAKGRCRRRAHPSRDAAGVAAVALTAPPRRPPEHRLGQHGATTRRYDRAVGGSRSGADAQVSLARGPYPPAACPA